jgi:hypothetical protein
MDREDSNEEKMERKKFFDEEWGKWGKWGKAALTLISFNS